MWFRLLLRKTMKYIIPPVLGFLLVLGNLLCPILMLFALPFIKWDKEPTWARDHTLEIIRGDLPKWLSWLSTPDERLPGGMYEPTVKDIYERRGKYFTSWYWLGVRNCLMNLAVWLGHETTDYIPEEPLGFWERDNTDTPAMSDSPVTSKYNYRKDYTWRYSTMLTKKIKFVIGYQVYKDLNGKFQAAPLFTLKNN